MSSEYDKLYSLLENALHSTKNTVITEPISVSIELSEGPVKKRGRGRPPGSKNIEKLQCLGCLQKFHLTQKKKYEKHCASSIACKKFAVLPEKPPILKKPIYQLIIDTLEQATSYGSMCIFCEKTITDMKEHMTISQVCNRMAYQEFKKLL
jgi:hypothetical protein